MYIVYFFQRNNIKKQKKIKTKKTPVEYKDCIDYFYFIIYFDL
jgi:hypothetical protein